MGKMIGHSEIILTDAITGEKQRYTNKNIVTNAVANILNPSPCFFVNDGNYHTFLQNNLPIETKLLSGVLLFGEQIEENPNTIYPPISNPQIGYASNNAYAGANPLRGSYNISESGKVDNSYRHVWDFSTNQANGTIRCLSLTHPMGGRGGWNTPVDEDYVFVKNIHENTITAPNAIARSDQNADIGAFCGNFKEGIYSFAKTSGKKISFYDLEMPDTVRLGSKVYHEPDYKNIIPIVKTSQYNLATASYNTSYLFSGSEFILSVMYISQSGALNTYAYVKFDGATKEIIEEKMITLPQGYLYLGESSYPYGEYEGYLYLRSLDGLGVAKINLANTAEIVDIPLWKTSTSTSDIKIYQFDNKLVVSKKSGIYSLFYYTEGGEFNPVKAYMQDNYSRLMPCKNVKPPYVLRSFNDIGRDGNACVSIIAPYLGTINNLQSSVAKTASQTMKVIYTLTDAEVTP